MLVPDQPHTSRPYFCQTLHVWRCLYPFVSRHCGCFPVLTILNNTAVNKALQVSLWDLDSMSLGYTPRHRGSRSYGSFVFNFEESLYCTTWYQSGTVSVPIYTPPPEARSILFPPHSHQCLSFFKLISENEGFCSHFFYVQVQLSPNLFDNKPPHRYKVLSHYGFNLHVPSDEWRWAPFYAPVVPLSSFDKCLFRCFVHSSSQLFDSLLGITW